MRAYIVQPVKGVTTDVKRKFAGSQSEAAQFKKDMKDDPSNELKRDQIRVDEVEIPTDKAGLLKWLNENI